MGLTRASRLGVEQVRTRNAFLEEENVVLVRRVEHLEAELRGAQLAVKHSKGEAGSLRDSNAFLVEERKKLGAAIEQLQHSMAVERSRVLQMDQQLLDLRKNHAGELAGCQAIIRQWQERAGALGMVRGIFEERVRQMSEEGWTREADDRQMSGELALAAVAYLMPDEQEDSECWWPFESETFKKAKHARVRQLEIAGALLLAEMERLERAGEGSIHHEGTKGTKEGRSDAKD